MFAIEKEVANRPRCLHPLAGAECGDRIIAAHTIQRRVGLRAIEEDGHVLSVCGSFSGLLSRQGKFAPERQGVRNASTFRGFCNKHDTSLFRPVEASPWTATKETAFLLSFRAVSFELYSKLYAEAIGREQKKFIDRGLPFHEQVATQRFLEDYLSGVRLGVRDASTWKNKFDETYLTGDYTEYRYLSVEFRPALPIVSCGGMHVEYDFNGHALQDLMRDAPLYEHLTFNITALDDASIVVFGWIGDPDGPTAKFIRSFLEQPIERRSHTVIRLAFENFENTFMRQSWWEALSTATKDRIGRHARSGFPDTGRPSNCLMEDGTDYFSAHASSNGIIL